MYHLPFIAAAHVAHVVAPHVVHAAAAAQPHATALAASVHTHAVSAVTSGAHHAAHALVNYAVRQASADPIVRNAVLAGGSMHMASTAFGVSASASHAATATSIAEGIAGAGLFTAFAVAKQAAVASARTKMRPLVDSAKEQLRALT